MIVHVQEIGQIVTLIICSKISFICIYLCFLHFKNTKKYYIGELKIVKVYTVKKAIGDLNLRRVIPLLVLESSISWVKKWIPSPGAFLFITDVIKIYFYSTDVQKSVIYVRKCIPSSLMQNVELIGIFWRGSKIISNNVGKFHKML